MTRQIDLLARARRTRVCCFCIGLALLTGVSPAHHGQATRAQNTEKAPHQYQEQRQPLFSDTVERVRIALALPGMHIEPTMRARAAAMLANWHDLGWVLDSQYIEESVELSVLPQYRTVIARDLATLAQEVVHTPSREFPAPEMPLPQSDEQLSVNEQSIESFGSLDVNIRNDSVEGLANALSPVEITIRSSTGAEKARQEISSDAYGSFGHAFSVDIIIGDQIEARSSGVTKLVVAQEVRGVVDIGGQEVHGTTLPLRQLTIYLYQIDRFVSTTVQADSAGQFRASAAMLGVSRIRSDDFAWLYVDDPVCCSTTKQVAVPHVLKAYDYGTIVGHAPPGIDLRISARAADGSLRRSDTTQASTADGYYHSYLNLTLQRGDTITVEGPGYSRSLLFVPITAWGYQSNDEVTGFTVPHRRIDVFLDRVYRTTTSDASGHFSVAYDVVRAAGSLRLMMEDTDGDLTYASAGVTSVTINSGGQWGDSVSVRAPAGSTVRATLWRYRTPVETLSATSSDSNYQLNFASDMVPGDVVQVEGAETVIMSVPYIQVTIDAAQNRISTEIAPGAEVQLAAHRNWMFDHQASETVLADSEGRASFSPWFTVGPATYATATTYDQSGNTFITGVVRPYTIYYGGVVELCAEEPIVELSLRSTSGTLRGVQRPTSNGLGCAMSTLSSYPEPGDTLTLTFARHSTSFLITESRIHVNKFLDRVASGAPPGSFVQIEVQNYAPAASEYVSVNESGAFVADFSNNGGIFGGQRIVVQYQYRDDVLFKLIQHAPRLTVQPRASGAIVSGMAAPGSPVALRVSTITGETRARMTLDTDATGNYAAALIDGNERAITVTPGETLVVTTGTVEETVVVPNFRVRSTDLSSNLIRGTADPDQNYYITARSRCVGCSDREFSSQLSVAANAAGAWEASFGDTFDVDRGNDLEASFYTPEGSLVLFDYVVPSRITVDSTRDIISGYTEASRTLQVTLRDRLGVIRHQQQSNSDSDGYFVLLMGTAEQPIDISAGDAVEVTAELSDGRRDTAVLRVAPATIAISAGQAHVDVETVGNRAFEWLRGNVRRQSGVAVAGGDGRQRIGIEPLGLGEFVQIQVDSGDFSGSATRVSNYLPALVRVDETLNSVDVLGPAFADVRLSILRGGVSIATGTSRIGRWNSLQTPLTFSVPAGIVDIRPYDEVRATIGTTTVTAQVQQLNFRLDLANNEVLGQGPPDSSLDLSVFLDGTRATPFSVRTNAAGAFQLRLPQGTSLSEGSFALLQAGVPAGHTTQIRAFSTAPTVALSPLPTSITAPGTLPVRAAWSGGQKVSSATLLWDTTSHASDRAYANSTPLSVAAQEVTGNLNLPNLSGRLFVAVRLVVDGQPIYSGERALSLEAPAPQSSTSGWTMLLYLDGDNDLSYWMQAAIQRLRLSDLPADVGVAILYDGAAPNDTFRYLLRPGRRAGAFTSAEQFPQGELNMGDPRTLEEFVGWARKELPASATYLSIANHGDGLVGIAYDTQDAPFRSLSKADPLTLEELELAFARMTNSGRQPFTLLHLDGCLMGTLEAVYQLRDAAEYIIASENLGWSVFSYERYVKEFRAGRDPAQTAAQIVATYSAAVLENGALPVSLAAINARKIDAVRERVDALAAALVAQLSSTKPTIQRIREQVQKLDTREFGIITNNDELVDLGHLADLVVAQLPGTPAATAAAALRTGMAELVVAERHESGQMPEGVHRENAARGVVALDHLSGLSIYWPPTTQSLGRPEVRDARYQNYLNGRLRFVQDSAWDTLLSSYFGPAALSDDQPAADEYVVPPTLSIESRQLLYLPVVRR